jgi:hypothetical protein
MKPSTLPQQNWRQESLLVDQQRNLTMLYASLVDPGRNSRQSIARWRVE